MPGPLKPLNKSGRDGSGLTGEIDHADTPGFCRNCVLRALRDYRICRHRCIGADHAAGGVTIGRHTHPGIESAYILEGGFELPIEGLPTRLYKPGDGFVVPPGAPHAGNKNGDVKTKVLSTYIVEKGKPLASPA